MMALSLALLCLFTIGAGAAVAGLMPHRLALFELPTISGHGVTRPGKALHASTGAPSTASSFGVATVAGVTARVSGLLKSGALGPRAGALVTDLSSGQPLYGHNATAGFTPASTTKIATAVAALQTLGPQERFSTRVVISRRFKASAGRSARIVLVGGGDPTLAVRRYPAGDYPQPATLTSLAAATARALRAKGIGSVSVTYDGSMFAGPTVAKGWKGIGLAGNYISSGNFAPISGLEVDQGRLTAQGTPQDSDDAGNFRPRSLTPSQDAAKAFVMLLRNEGISVRGKPSGASAPQRGTELAAIRSPALAAIVQQMLTESNNVIAETLARQVAVATGRGGTFAGAAAAVTAAAAKLGVHGLHLYDGSGLSPLDRISPQALVGLVGVAAKSGARLRPVITGMPVAGFSGTLGPGSFFGPFGTAGLGMVRAKTGNLNHVATMAGLAMTTHGQLLAFAFMGNGIPDRLGTEPESALAQLATALAGCGCG
jgi:D-alanyl-D-alanine carboxypeptidase/D-alanyl-D-alanine-endopeptidase (penicillin-binding protein 4)